MRFLVLGLLCACTSPRYLAVPAPDPDASPVVAPPPPWVAPDAGVDAEETSRPVDSAAPAPDSADAPADAVGALDVPEMLPDAPPDLPPDKPPRPDRPPPPPPPDRCPAEMIFCNTTNKCQVPVICLLEYQGGSTNLRDQHLGAFCAAAPGGAALPDASGIVYPAEWAAAASDGTCDAFNARAAQDLCGGAVPQHRLGARRIVYDATTGDLQTAVPLAGPVCP